MDPRIQPAADAVKIGTSSSYTVPTGRYAKGIRVNSDGVLTITTNGQTQDTWDVLQGERLDVGGSITVETDSNATAFVYL